MKWTNAFIPTLREAAADAEILSHKLEVRIQSLAPLVNSVE
jgi:prolyl-tRNA synthetase